MTQYEVAVFARKNSKKPYLTEYFGSLDAAKVFAGTYRLYRIREVENISLGGLIVYPFTGYKHQNF